MLSEPEIERFVTDGVVKLPEAFPREVADECRRRLWEATGCDEHDPTTWTRPVIRIDGRGDEPFRAAANTPRLYEAFDQLAGPGGWVPLGGIGTFPIRFPSDEPPGDDGWHIESTGAAASGRPVVDPPSTARVLLLLFLFSEVGEDDAPTKVRLGSHVEAARLLAEGPQDFFDIAARLEKLTEDHPEALATGSPGDVWLCHPYVVHSAQPHHGTRVRFVAQPPLPGTAELDATRPGASPVEEAIWRALYE